MKTPRVVRALSLLRHDPAYRDLSNAEYAVLMAHMIYFDGFMKTLVRYDRAIQKDRIPFRKRQK